MATTAIARESRLTPEGQAAVENLLRFEPFFTHWATLHFRPNCLIHNTDQAEYEATCHAGTISALVGRAATFRGALEHHEIEAKPTLHLHVALFNVVPTDATISESALVAFIERSWRHGNAQVDPYLPELFKGSRERGAIPYSFKGYGRQETPFRNASELVFDREVRFERVLKDGPWKRWHYPGPDTIAQALTDHLGASHPLTQAVRTGTLRPPEPAATANLRLTIDLAPATHWFWGLFSAIKRKGWNKLGNRITEQYGNRCAICQARRSGTEPLYCDEVWQFDAEERRQRLCRFLPLCHLCHYARHISLAERLDRIGRLSPSLPTIREHFQKVNGCDRAVFEAHREQVFHLWAWRSLEAWHSHQTEQEEGLTWEVDLWPLLCFVGPGSARRPLPDIWEAEEEPDRPLAEDFEGDDSLYEEWLTSQSDAELARMATEWEAMREDNRRRLAA